MKTENNNRAKDIADELKELAQPTDSVEEITVTAKPFTISKQASTRTNSKLIATALTSKVAVTNAGSKAAVMTTTSKPAITTATALGSTFTRRDDCAEILENETVFESGTSDCSLKLINMVSLF